MFSRNFSALFPWFWSIYWINSYHNRAPIHRFHPDCFDTIPGADLLSAIPADFGADFMNMHRSFACFGSWICAIQLLTNPSIEQMV
jgi:hypothetical protein